MIEPFRNSGEVEVLVRVFRAYVKMRFRRAATSQRSWARLSEQLYPQLRQFNGTLSLYTVLLAFSTAHMQGRKFDWWTNEAIRRCRFGLTWRAALYPQYKITRRAK
jgi:hypothetical protein